MLRLQQREAWDISLPTIHQVNQHLFVNDMKYPNTNLYRGANSIFYLGFFVRLSQKYWLQGVFFCFLSRFCAYIDHVNLFLHNQVMSVLFQSVSKSLASTRNRDIHTHRHHPSADMLCDIPERESLYCPISYLLTTGIWVGCPGWFSALLYASMNSLAIYGTTCLSSARKKG